METFAFTPTEAAALTGLPVKAINKAIENKLVPARFQRSGKIKKRYLSHTGLICLQLEAKGMSVLPVQTRRYVFEQVVQSPKKALIRHSDAVLIDVKSARQTLAASLSSLRKARKMVVHDPEILQGTPVVRGTRIPVYLITDMLDSGATVEEILEGYPSLTDEIIRLAQLYATAFPKRGRPQKRRPKRGAVLSRRRLNAVA